MIKKKPQNPFRETIVIDGCGFFQLDNSLPQSKKSSEMIWGAQLILDVDLAFNAHR